MKIAFLNLCHCDPEMVARVTKKLTKKDEFYMFVHVDKKSDESLFKEEMKDCEKVFFVENRQDVSWGSYSAITATLELMKTAVNSGIGFDRYVLLQNLDYPIKSNEYIHDFFEKNKNVEYIRACKIAKTRDWHFSSKYKLYHDYEVPFYRKKKTKLTRLVHGVTKIAKSIPYLSFNGIIVDQKQYPIYYGAAQWALTDSCVKYILKFSDRHKAFNERMKHIQFPDEEYFHTIVHNSSYKTNCVKYNEPEKRWLVNWRNIHYFEYPREITVFKEEDYSKLMEKEDLFIRKVRTGISDTLLDKIDQATE